MTMLKATVPGLGTMFIAEEGLTQARLREALGDRLVRVQPVTNPTIELANLLNRAGYVSLARVMAFADFDEVHDATETAEDSALGLGDGE